MADRRTYTPAEKAEALKLYEEQGPTAASEQTGIPKGTIASWAMRAGLQTDRTPKTAAATQAASVDAASVRQGVASKSISAADKAVTAILDRLDTEAHEMPLKELATVLGILSDKHAVITRMDADANEHSAVDEWIAHMIGGGDS
ncbi:hypothetical protein [Brachybacterium massiliense]|uniref:hypothetical protein n=1 Tax=Brachybacterium massiliense TaxID=1755098 RepID=UPI000B3BC281|nr:hypothetical protein [Brachybacterium massiliense]